MSDKVTEILEKLKKSAKKVEKPVEEDFNAKLEEAKKIVEQAKEIKELPEIKPNEGAKLEASEIAYNILNDDAFFRNQLLFIESKKAESLEAIVLILSKLLE
jgi:DNA helicase IV